MFVRRLRVGRLPVGAVVKTSSAFAAVFVGVVTLIASLAYLVGYRYGVVAGIDRLVSRLLQARHFRLSPLLFVGGAAGISVVIGALAVAVVALAAVVYNRIGDLTGGLAVTLQPIRSSHQRGAGAPFPAVRATAGRRSRFGSPDAGPACRRATGRSPGCLPPRSAPAKRRAQR